LRLKFTWSFSFKVIQIHLEVLPRLLLSLFKEREDIGLKLSEETRQISYPQNSSTLSTPSLPPTSTTVPSVEMEKLNDAFEGIFFVSD
jgi:hypothetical protein